MLISLSSVELEDFLEISSHRSLTWLRHQTFIVDI